MIEQGGTHGALSTGNLTLGLLQHIAAAAQQQQQQQQQQMNNNQQHNITVNFCTSAGGSIKETAAGSF